MKYNLTYLDTRHVNVVQELIKYNEDIIIIEENRLNTYIRVEASLTLEEMKELFSRYCIISKVGAQHG